jgi:hypothetical protein
VKAPVRLAVTAAILFVTGGFLITHASVTSSRSLPKAAVRLTATDTAVAPHRASATDDGAVVDLSGNEVNNAIATYTLDPNRSLR